MTDEKADGLMALVTLHGEAQRLAGFLEALALSQERDAADGCVEIAATAIDIARWFGERIAGEVSDADE